MDQMKLIIPWYKLNSQAFKYQDLENVLSKGSSCTILKMRLFNKKKKNLERKNRVFLKKSLESSMVLVQSFFFFFQWLKGPMPLVQTLSHLNFILFYFFGKIWESWFFFFFWKFFSFFGKDLGILNFFFFWI